ncbi:MAG TPA: universal stress protein [Candidatus Limnocylindrales bacterium]|nr:universal stress protein [Candidatus Limnocylindrales bacterium]
MRVVVAYDGSKGAEQALALADAIRWPAGTTLRIVTVIEPPLLYLGPPLGGPVVVPEIDEDLTAYAQELASDAARRLRSDRRTVETVVLHGRPGSALVEEAERSAADLVICGSRGHGRVLSLLLGSVSAEIVDHAPCPVLVARKTSLGRVVFATDGSAASAAAETLLATWPIFEGVPIRVVTVADVAEPWHTGIAPTLYAQVLEAHARDLDQAKTECRRIADEAAARLRAAGRDAQAELRTGGAAAEIIAATEATGADLVVIGSRGQTGLAGILLGSVARNVLHGSKASVLVVRGARPSVR